MTRWKWHDWALFLFRTLVFVSVWYNAAKAEDQFALPFWVVDAAVGLSYLVPLLLLLRSRLLYLAGEIEENKNELWVAAVDQYQ